MQGSMTIIRMFGTGFAMLLPSVVIFAFMIGSSMAAPGCQALSQIDAPIYSPPLGQVVIGAGRLQFYSAPSDVCPMTGVFIIPRDAVIAYSATDDGWTSVMYLRADGSDVQGWVRSSRLRTTGTMGPSQ